SPRLRVQFRALVCFIGQIDEPAPPVNGEFQLVVMSCRPGRGDWPQSLAGGSANRPYLGMTEWVHANCFKKRRSFCEKSRISGISNRIIASRSMPSPNA